MLIAQQIRYIHELTAENDRLRERNRRLESGLREDEGETGEQSGRRTSPRSDASFRPRWRDEPYSRQPGGLSIGEYEPAGASERCGCKAVLDCRPGGLSRSDWGHPGVVLAAPKSRDVMHCKVLSERNGHEMHAHHYYGAYD